MLALARSSGVRAFMQLLNMIVKSNNYFSKATFIVDVY